MSDDSISMILKAINDMQDKINGDLDEKLKNYVTQPQFSELENELKACSRRVGYNEGVLKDNVANIEKNGELIDNNRKRIQRLQ